MYGVLGIRTLGAAEWNAAQHSCTYQRHESAQSEFDVATIINFTRWYFTCSLLFWNGLGLQGSNKLKSYIMFQKRNIFIISEKVEVPLQNWPGLFLFSCRYGYVLGVILSNERKLFG